nr:reverse transcriptase domain-containing protein [Tanacetum cinerariifolium]
MENNQVTCIPSGPRIDTSLVHWKFEPLIDLTYEKLKETRGQAIIIAQPWEDLKMLLMEEYFLDYSIKKQKKELWNYVVIGADANKCTARLHEMARLVPHLVTSE